MLKNSTPTGAPTFISTGRRWSSTCTSTGTDVTFDASAGSLIKATVKGEGLTAADLTLVGPDGPVEFTAKEGKGSVKLQAVLDKGTGTYRIVVGRALEVAWKWKLKLAKKVKAEIRG